MTFEWFDGLTFDQMLKRVAELPPHSAIFYTDIRVDAAGTRSTACEHLTDFMQRARANVQLR